MSEHAYEIVDDSAVPPEVRLAAERTLRHCCADLGLPLSTRLVWLKPTHTAVAKMESLLWRLSRMAGDFSFEPRAALEPGPMDGMYRAHFRGESDVVLVRADLSPREAALTAAHEARHAHRVGRTGRYRPPFTPAEAAWHEQDAESYAQRVVARLFGT